MSEPTPASLSRRFRTIAWLLLAVAAVAAFVTGGQPWWQAVTVSRTVAVSGTEAAAGLPQALAAVVAAGLLLSLTLRRWGRVVLGALLALTGVGAIVLGLAAPRPTDEVLANLVQQVTLDAVTDLRPDWGGYGFAAAGALAALGGVSLILASRNEPPRADRFRRPDPAARFASTGPEDDPLEVWRAMDAGQDPTAESDPGAAPEAPAGDEAIPGADHGTGPISRG